MPQMILYLDKNEDKVVEWAKQKYHCTSKVETVKTLITLFGKECGILNATKKREKREKRLS